MGFCVDLGPRNFCIGSPTGALHSTDLSAAQGGLIFVGILAVTVAFFISRGPR